MGIEYLGYGIFWNALCKLSFVLALVLQPFLETCISVCSSSTEVDSSACVFIPRVFPQENV